VILTTIGPHQPDRFAQVAWQQLLQPGGILAVLTHSDHDAGELLDPTTPLIHAAHRQGLTWLDHIIITGHRLQPTDEDHTGDRHVVDDTSERPATADTGAAQRQRRALRPVAHAVTRQPAPGRAPTDAPTPLGGHPTHHGHAAHHGHDDLLIFLGTPPPPPGRARTRRGAAR
jgi:hypothetical protein